MKLHAKAKVLIFDHLDRMERAREKMKKKKVADNYDIQVNFEQMQEELFDLLIKEDPEEAKRMGILSGQIQSDDEYGVKMLDKQEEEDNGLETQVQQIVDKFTNEFE